MLLALSKFLPRVFHKKTNKSERSTSNGVAVPENGKNFNCRVLLLDDSELSLDVKLTAKGCVLLNRVFLHLNLVEKEYFGLRYLEESNQPLWLDLTKSITSQLPAGELPYTFYFGVKFYAVDPCKLSEEITRYQFFLQVKRDILQGRLPVPVEMAAHLAAYAVQSELGDFSDQSHPLGYVSEFSFIPNQTLDFENKVASIHQTLKGQVPAQAEYQYLDKVKWLDMYGVDLHPVLGDGNIDYFLGLTPSGIVIYKNKSKVSNYYWPRVLKITYKNKLFLIKARDKNNEENTYTFECSSKQACKHLYKCCVDYHTFYRLTSASHSFQQSKARLLSFSSKHGVSGKSSKSEQSDTSERSEQTFVRRPSQRKPQKRISGSESCPEDLTRMPRPLSAVVLSQPVSKYHQRDGYSSGPESSRFSSLHPWEGGNCHRGLYTGRGSPTSVRSEYFPRFVMSGSESDSTLCPRRHRHRIDPSDTETEAGSCHHRHRRGNATESESDVGSHHGHHRHRHRHRGRSAENVNGLETQWKCTRPRVCDDHLAGSMSSMASIPEQRRHRKRSKSPGNQPPQELAQHFRRIEDPSELGITEESFKNLPYFRVESLNQRFSPRTRHKIRQYRRQKSCGELPVGSQFKLPEGEPPPPYLGGNKCHPRFHQNPPSSIPHHQCQRLETELLRSPMAVQITETHQAPIVKTREIVHSEEGPFAVDRMIRDPARPSICQEKQLISHMHEQVIYQKEPRRIEGGDRNASAQRSTTNHGLGFHVREDSGLELDSPGGSSSSQAVESLSRAPLLTSHHLHPQHQQLICPEVVHLQRSPIAGTPAPSFRTSATETSPYIEQASFDNFARVSTGSTLFGQRNQSHQSVRSDSLAAIQNSHGLLHFTSLNSHDEDLSHYPDHPALGTFHQSRVTDL